MQGKRPAAGSVVGVSRYVSFGPFRLDRQGLVLSIDGRPTAVQPKALEVLRGLVDRAGEVVLKQDLLDVVWEDAAVTENSLTEAVRLLRKALDDDPRDPTYIETVHRRGYRFIAPIASGGVPAAGAGVVARDELSRVGKAAWRRRLASGLGVTALVLSVAFSSVISPRPEAETDPDTLPDGAFVVRPPENGVFRARYVDLVFTSDGSHLVYVVVFGGELRLFVRHRDGRPPQPLPLRPDADALFAEPFAAPDGEHVAFISSGLNVLSVADGSFETLCKPCGEQIGVVGFSGGDWAPDGTIVFAHRYLMRLSAHGGSSQVPDPVPSEVIDRLGGHYVWPSFLPGGRKVLVTHRTGDRIHGAQVYLVDIESGAERILLEEASKARYVDSGHVVFMRGNDLWAVAFDLARGTPVGEPVRVIEGIATSDWVGEAQYTISDAGDLAYLPGPFYSLNDATLLSTERRGETTRLFDRREEFEGLRLSPSGERLAVSVYNPLDRDIRIYELDNEDDYVDITRPVSSESFPIWHPDGDRIAYLSEREGAPRRIMQARVDGGLQFDAEVVSSDARWLFPTSWSPDGETIAYTIASGDRPGPGSDVWVVDMASFKARPFAATERDELEAVFSPDGRYLAYVRDTEVVVAPFPEGGSAEPVAPWTQRLRWARRGDGVHELFFGSEGRMWALQVLTVGGVIEAGEPERFPARTYRGADFDVAPGGGRIIQADRRLVDPESAEIVVIPNWLDFLERLVPTAR